MTILDKGMDAFPDERRRGWGGGVGVGKGAGIKGKKLHLLAFEMYR